MDHRPIGDYGIIGDCRTAALVSRDGSIDWCCFPDFDGPSVFGRILDTNIGGHFSIQPEGSYKCQQSYIEGTNVLTTLFEAAGGTVRLIDFMPIPQTADSKSPLAPMRQIIRIVEGVSGQVQMRMDYSPRPDYASKDYRLRLRSPYAAVTEGKGWQLMLLSEPSLELDGKGGATASFSVAAGKRVTLGLAYDADAPSVHPAVTQAALDLLEQTVGFWRSWLGACQYDGPYKEAVKRSALALKLMEFVPSGAIIAAPTASLPEKVGGTRNWDYRYTWLRDAAFTLEALQAIGYTEEATTFLDWLLHSTRTTHPKLEVVYTVYGEASIPAHEMEHLEGYRGSRPVRIGNKASKQYQLDVYGELLDGLFRIDPSRCESSNDARNLVMGAADFVAQHWRDADNGIWEMEQKAQFTHSKALCWLALDRALRLMNESKVPDKQVRKWKEARDSVMRIVLEQGYSKEAGAFVQKLEGHDLDASLLTLPIHHMIDPRDPRMLSTVKAIRERLTANGLVYRYLSDDGLPPGEGAFLICNFWLAQALALQGDIDSAHQAFEDAMRCATHLGLLSEEADPNTFETLGNFPQGLTHIGLINAAVALQRTEG